MQKQGHCFLCFRKAGHLARDCDCSIKCFRCRGHHHVDLCEKNLSFRSDSKEKSEKPKKSEATSTEEKKTTETQTTTFCGVNTGDQKQNTRILLQTAFVSGKNMDDTGQNIRLIILDSGSQRTYITKRAREVLHLNTLRHDMVIVYC